MPDLLQISSSYFLSREAVTPGDLAAVYRIRYRVYCEEAGYFDPKNFPDGLEIDAYDDRSAKSLLIYRPTNAPVGAARLILPASDLDSLDQFPFDSVCDPAFVEDLKLLPRDSTAELSRFCVTQTLTRQIAAAPPEDLDPWDLARHAKLWLMQSLVEMSLQNQITHWCAVMEPWFIRSLKKMGIVFTPLGPPVEYYGERQPCYGEVHAVLNRLKREQREIWNVITDRGRLAQ